MPVPAAGGLAALRQALPQLGAQWPSGLAEAAVSGSPRQCRRGAAGAGAIAEDSLPLRHQKHPR